MAFHKICGLGLGPVRNPNPSPGQSSGYSPAERVFAFLSRYLNLRRSMFPDEEEETGAGA
jgi:hypothetical protein